MSAIFSNSSKMNWTSLKREDTDDQFVRRGAANLPFRILCPVLTTVTRAHPCNVCHLLDFVSPENRTQEVPCHHIPLNADGDTIEDLELQDNQAKLEREVSAWLRAKIAEIEHQA
jgi:hypothetical protein